MPFPPLFRCAPSYAGRWKYVRETILNALRAALRIFSGKKILNFGFQESLRTFLKPIFTGRGLDGEQHVPVPARSSPLFEAERAERSQQKAPPAAAGGALDFIHNTDAPP